jgi:hypothetical protein
VFTSTDETSMGIYMLRNLKTGAAYIGASTSIANRLEAHRNLIKNRTCNSYNPLGRKILEAFKKLEDTEFRVLEFIVPKYGTEDGEEFLSEETVTLLDERERHWICTLRPSLNRYKTSKRESVESLPYGAPPPAMTGAKRAVTK